MCEGIFFSSSACEEQKNEFLFGRITTVLPRHLLICSTYHVVQLRLGRGALERPERAVPNSHIGFKQ
jgi:hypothetical protein